MSNENQPVILIITIDLGEGKKANINIKEDDDPNDLAYDFVIKNNLGLNIVNILAENIRSNLSALENEREEEEIKNNGNIIKTSPAKENTFNNRFTVDVHNNISFRYPNDSQIFKNSDSQNRGGIEKSFSVKPISDNSYLYKENSNRFSENNVKVRKNFNSFAENEGKSGTNLDSFTENERKISKNYNNNYIENDNNLNDFTENEGRISKKENKLIENEGKFSIFLAEKTSFFHENDKKRRKSKNENSTSFMEPNSYYPENEEYTFTPHINATSTEMIQRRNNGISVHERLFAQAKRKKRMQNNNSFEVKPKRLSTQQSQPTVKKQINYGERLYQRSVKQREIRLRSIEIQKIERLKENDKNNTFHPNIDEISSLIGRYKRTQKVEDYLNDFAKEKQAKIEKKVEMQKSFEIKDCSFHPRINKISEIIDIEKQKFTRSISLDRFTRLYDVSREYDSKKQELRKSIDQKYSFKPQLNQTSLQMTENQDFFTRLEKFNYLKSEKEKLNKTCQEIELVDPETGVEFFKPQICRVPKLKRNLEKMPVGEYLYSRRTDHIKKKQKIMDELNIAQSKAEQAKFNPNSQRIFASKQLSFLHGVFLLFDSDQDGVISASNIDISKVPDHILEGFSPLLAELEEAKVWLDWEEFKGAGEKLMRGMTVEERRRIMGVGRKEEEGEKIKFQPEINMKSQVLALKKRREWNDGDIYDYYIHEKQVWNEKRKSLKLQKEAEEMRECYFRPQISRGYKI